MNNIDEYNKDMKIKLVILFIFAFLIRLIAINQSLWLDEATSVMVVKHLTYGEILFKFSPFDFHPPGYYFFLKFWTGIFGFSEIAIRLPSVIASILTGYVVYLTGKKVSNAETGFWATAYYLFNPLAIYYSQEARMYSLVTLFLTILIYLLLVIDNLSYSQNQKSKVKSPSFVPLSGTTAGRQKYNSKVKSYLIVGTLVFLSVFTFYGSVLLITTLIIYFLFKKNYQTAFYFIIFLFLILLLLTPLLIHQLDNAKSMLNVVSNWKSVLGKADLKNLLLIPLKFTSGRISFFPKIVYYVLSGIWAIIISFFVFRGVIRNRMLGWLLIFPIIIGLVISFVTPMLQYFRFIYLLPIMAVLISVGIKELKGSRVNELTSYIRILVLLGFVIWSLVYLLIPQFHREDWKSLAYSLPKQAKVYMMISSSDVLSYYRFDIHLVDVQSIKRLTDMDNNLIIIPYTTEIYGVDYKTILYCSGYKMSKEKTFRGLLIEYWEKV